MATSIWYVSKYVAPPGLGNVGGRGYLLMKEFASMGHKVTIITSDSNHLAKPPSMNVGYLIQNVDGIQLCWVRTMKYSVAKSIRRILSWLHFEWRLLLMPHQKFSKPDVVVVSSLSLLTILNGLLWRIRYKCRLVFEIRDIWPLTIVEEGGFKPWNPLVIVLAVVERIGYRYADAIVGTMPNLGEHVCNVVGYWKITHCIPMGLDQLTSGTLEELPQDYVDENFPKNKFIVAHVGSIGITNALDTFLDCATNMKDHDEIHFLVVGDGDLRNGYIEKYKHLGNLTFAPKVSKDKVQAVLSQCDLLYFSVHSSKVWQYGQSLNKVIDYMVSGKPIVASYTGFTSMINEANCGSYVPAGDVISLKREIERYASMSQSELAEIGLRGKTWILNNRSYQKLAKNYLEILFPDGNLTEIST
jgi:glycosyltransferase involved in cell wall biosynthesis